jgi:two-component system phosphate regulon sensor histidine kinase PhoR
MMDAVDGLLDALPDPAIAVNRRSLVLAANAAARALFPRLVTGDPLAFAIRDPDILAAAEAVLAGDGARTAAFMERVPVERWFEAHVAGVATWGEPVALLVLRETTAMRRADRMRVDFVANASHELRTPLAAILGFIETLQGPAKADIAARERFLAIMAEQARRMARLVDDLLSLSRIEQNAHVRPTSTVDLAHVCGETINALSHLAEERGVSIRFAPLPAGLSPRVTGDRDELIRVVENLVENAIKYGGSGGSVDLALEAAAPARAEVTLTVMDHGPGIPEEHIPRLTERFYRVDVASSREKGGTGLGLAIVKHIVARHRGRLDIRSERGKGSTFAVTLPAAGV